MRIQPPVDAFHVMLEKRSQEMIDAGRFGIAIAGAEEILRRGGQPSNSRREF